MTDLVWTLIIGGIAGWLAGTLIKGAGFGILADIVIGVIGGFLFGLIGLAAYGLLGQLLVATIGAMILVWIVRQLKK